MIILQVSDIHIFNNKRHYEFEEQFKKLYKIVENEKIDIVVICGDLVDNKNNISNEAKLVAGELLNQLSTRCKEVVIIPGNHDCNVGNLNRKNSVETVVELINNPKIIYFGKSGFFQDNKFDNIIWVNHSHLEKTINPWKDIKHKKDKNKIYIDLFHDPIHGVKLFNGFTMDRKHLKNISSFKGDISMFGDIHKFGYYGDGKKAYSSSLVQIDFGESVNEHGCLVWHVTSKDNITSKFFNIKNTEHAFITFKTQPGVDYDDLEIKPVESSDAKSLEARIIWNDYSSNDNKENETKLRRYIHNVYPNVINIRIEKEIIYTDSIDGKLLSESIDINDKDIQKDIIKEYMNLNKYDKKIIENIFDIDDIINNKLHINKTSNITWDIDKLWFNNFKSYGDNNEIIWKDLNSVIQIKGLNQGGKTSILDVICYILYGTTLSTTKREKHGDNRYINNKRKLNQCDGGAIIDVNGQKYIIYRITERIIKKGIMKSCSTKLDYYIGEEMNEDNKQNGENRVKTQQLLDGILGEFNDFIRLCLTNADNLNDLLSMDRSVFIDSLMKDAGYDIFELKLNEFKEYKKSLNLEKINVDVLKEEEDIVIYEKEVKDLKYNLNNTEKLIDINDVDVKKNITNKDNLLKKLNKIDNTININEINHQIDDKNINISHQEMIINGYDAKLKELPETFDIDGYNELNDKYNKFIEKINTNKLNQRDLKNNIDKIESSITSIDDNIKNLIKDKISDINTDINNNDYEIKSIKKDIDDIKNKVIDTKKQISLLEDPSDDGRICPTCKRLLKTEEDFNHIREEIDDHKKILKGYYDDGKYKISEMKVFEEKNIELSSDINSIKKEYYIKFDELSSSINKLESDKKLLIEKTKNIEKELEDCNTLLEKLKLTKLRGDEKLKLFNENKTKFEERKNISYLKNDNLLQLKETKKELTDLNSKVDKYNENIELIKENEKINLKISEIENAIENIKNNNKELTQSKIDTNSNITLKNKIISDIKNKLRKYKELQEIEHIHKTYILIMGRNGIPTFLMKKSIHIINNELFNLLSNVDFNLYFNEELNLRLSSKKRLDINQSVVESSGKERTFASCALKLALRNINVNSKCSIIFLDEIMGKLIGDSVSEFSEFLDKISKRVKNVIIIEHNHTINFQHQIEVFKNDDEISSFLIS